MRYQEYIKQARRAVHLRRAVEALLWTSSWLGVALALLYAAGAWTQPAGMAQSVLGLIFAALLAVGVIWGVAVPSLRPVSERQIIRMVERLHPELLERLSTSHYLQSKPAEVERFRFSEALVRQTLDWAEREVQPAYFAVFQSWRSVRRAGELAAVVVIAWFALLVFDFENVQQTARAYWRAIGYANSFREPVEIAVAGDIEVRRGESATVRATLSRPVVSAKVHLRSQGDAWQSFPMQGQQGHFQYVVPEVKSPLVYFVSSGGQSSTPGSIRPVDPPRIEKFVFYVEPPAYTGLAAHSVEQSDGNFQAPEGSRVKLVLMVNNELERAELVLEDANVRAMSLTGSRSATLALGLSRPMSYRVNLVDRFGYETRELGPYELTPKVDRPPAVFVHSPPLVSDLGERLLVPVDWEVVDDYGISQVELFYRLNHVEVFRQLTLARSVSAGASSQRDAAAALIFQPTGALRKVFAWDLSALDLLPGDEVNFYLVGWDNDALHGPKAATSEVHLLRLPTAYELYEEMRPQRVSQVEQLDRLLEQQRQIRRDTEQLRENLERRMEDSRSPEQAGERQAAQWEEQQKLDQLNQRQEQLNRDLESLVQEIQNTFQKLNEPGSFSVKTLQKMARIQELLDQLLSEDMKAVLYQFQKTLEQIAEQNPVEVLDELAFSIEEYEENLDRMLSLLESSLVEQQLEAMMQQAEALQQEQEALQQESDELARQQEQLSQEKLSEPEAARKKEELARKQQQLSEQQKALEEKTQNLLKRMEELAQDQSGKNEPLSQGLQEALKQSRQDELTQSQEQAAEQLQSGQTRQAVQLQQRALEGLSQLQQNLASLQGAMGGMDFQRDLVELRRALDRALVLSERQEQAVAQLTPLGQGLLDWESPLKKTRSEVSILQRYYRDEALRIEAQLRQIAQKDPFLDFQAIRYLRLAARAMERAVAWGEDFGPSRVMNEARLALGQLNTAILSLLDSLNSLAQAQAASSMQGYFQSLNELIQRQQQLNMRTREQQRQRGQVPDWQQELQRLAREQAALRRQVEELYRKFGKLEDLLGDLGQVGQEMREVEKELEDLNADEKVQEKQERILTRLLDAEKSVQEQGYSRERESETAGEYQVQQPAGLPESDQMIRSRVQKLRQGLGEEDVPAEYRDRVRYYFRRLSEET